MSEYLGVGHSVFGNHRNGSSGGAGAGVYSSMWWFPVCAIKCRYCWWTLIRAMPAAHCPVLLCHWCGCAVTASLQMFVSDYFNPHNWQIPKAIREVFSNELNQLLEKSQGAGWHFLGSRAGETFPCLQSWDCPVGTGQGLIGCDKEQRTHLLFKLHMLFNFPHKELHVNVLSHSSLDYNPNRVLIFVFLRLEGSLLMYWEPVSSPVNDAERSGLAAKSCSHFCGNAIPLSADSQENIATLWLHSKGTRAEHHIVQIGDAAAQLFKSIFICNVTAQQWEPSWVEAVGIICFDLVYFIARWCV